MRGCEPDAPSNDAGTVPFAKIHADDLAPSPGLHPASSQYDKPAHPALGLSAFGLYRVDLPPHAETFRHDHRADDVEDAYAVVAGSGTVLVDEERVEVVAGDLVSVTPDARRHVRAGPQGLSYIAVCATRRS